MSPEIILGLIMGVPVLILLLLRVNAALVFLSLCLGAVLVQFVAPDTATFAGLFTRSGVDLSSTSGNTIKLVLLLLPVVLTTIFMIRSVHGRSRQVLNILPAAGVGLLGALLVVPLTEPGLRFAIYGSPLWQTVQKADVLIVGSSALICLLFIWMQRPKHHGKEGKHGKKHKG